MRCYEFDGKRSLTSISDNMFHGAAAVIASIKPILDGLVQNNCKKSLLLVTLYSFNTGIKPSFGLSKSFLCHTLLLSSGYT